VNEELRNPPTGNFGKKTPFGHSDSPMYECSTVCCFVHVQSCCMVLVVASVVKQTLLSLSACLVRQLRLSPLSRNRLSVNRDCVLHLTARRVQTPSVVPFCLLFVDSELKYAIRNVAALHRSVCCTLQSLRTSLLTDTHHFVHTAVQRVCSFVRSFVCCSILLFALTRCCHKTRVGGGIVTSK